MDPLATVVMSNTCAVMSLEDSKKFRRQQMPSISRQIMTTIEGFSTHFFSNSKTNQSDKAMTVLSGRK